MYRLAIVILRSWTALFIIWFVLFVIPLIAEHFIPGCSVPGKSPATGCGDFTQFINHTNGLVFFLSFVVTFTVIPMLVVCIVLALWGTKLR